MFLLFVLLPALVLCMVTPQAESKKIKRTSALNMVEDPEPAERVAFSEGIEGLTQQTSFMEIEESAEILEQSSSDDDMAVLDSFTPQVAPLQTENLAERVFSNPIGAVSHVASFLDAEDFDNLMHSKVNLRNSRLFYSNKANRIPFDATEDAVRRMIASNTHIEKVTIDFNLGHLTILKECRKLRHLEVEDETPDVFNEETTSPFMNMLSTFGNLTTLKILKFSGNVVVDIAPLASLIQLTGLELNLPGLVNITALSEMTKLIKLTLAETSVADLSPLSALTLLKELTVSNSDELVDLTPLASLKGLSKLDLNRCGGLVNISPLEHLNQMTELNLWLCSGLVDISPLETLTQLTWLDLSHSTETLTDFTPLSSLTNMRTLYLTCTSIVDLTPLEGMTQLTVLTLLQTEVSDIAPLSSLIQIKRLNLADTPVDDISSLEHLTELEFLNLALCDSLDDISPLKRLTQLAEIYLTGSQVTDISPLSGMINLVDLEVDPDLDISPLAHLTQLRIDQDS
jgi:Leucine-rich repeat (LRR) protein